MKEKIAKAVGDHWKSFITSIGICGSFLGFMLGHFASIQYVDVKTDGVKQEIADLKSNVTSLKSDMRDGFQGVSDEIQELGRKVWETRSVDMPTVRRTYTKSKKHKNQTFERNDAVN